MLLPKLIRGLASACRLEGQVERLWTKGERMWPSFRMRTVSKARTRLTIHRVKLDRDRILLKAVLHWGS
jgi:hypothetical protein